MTAVRQNSLTVFLSQYPSSNSVATFDDQNIREAVVSEALRRRDSSNSSSNDDDLYVFHNKEKFTSTQMKNSPTWHNTPQSHRNTLTINRTDKLFTPYPWSYNTHARRGCLLYVLSAWPPAPTNEYPIVQSSAIARPSSPRCRQRRNRCLPTAAWSGYVSRPPSTTISGHFVSLSVCPTYCLVACLSSQVGPSTTVYEYSYPCRCVESAWVG